MTELELKQKLQDLNKQVEEAQRKFKRAKRNQFIGTLIFTILGSLVGTVCWKLLVK